MQQLISLVSQWSRDRKIVSNSSAVVQLGKLVSEIGELADNVVKGRCVKDDIGDCIVVLNTLALMNDTTLEECLAHAYDDIKDRKGYMNELGVFIKEGDTA
jgi:NTP pyrophosphatase (non-canonical NTP hydrolase)